MERAVTVTEAARHLGVSRRKVWELVRTGHLPSYPDPTDGRKKLGPLSALAELRPTPPARALPSWVGMLESAPFTSEDAEEYMVARRDLPAC
jgi:excisionase family DNA binding protein